MIKSRRLFGAISYSPSMQEFLRKTITIENTTVYIYLPQTVVVSLSRYYNMQLYTKTGTIAKAFPQFKPLNPEETVTITFLKIKGQDVHKLCKTNFNDEVELIKYLFNLTKIPPLQKLARLLRNNKLHGRLNLKRTTIFNDGTVVYVHNKNKNIITTPCNKSVILTPKALELVPSLKSKIKVL